MQGRTYRYFTKAVQYPFGYGLSYTHFDYTFKQPPLATYTLKDTIQFTIQVHNTGAMDGSEVVQAYIEYPNIKDMPVKELKAFKKVAVNKNGTADVTLNIPVSELQKWDALQHGWKLYKGTYTIAIGKNANEYIMKKTFTVK
jgi:beta-glucosidase